MQLRVQMGLGGEATQPTLRPQWHALVGGGGSAGKSQGMLYPGRPCEWEATEGAMVRKLSRPSRLSSGWRVRGLTYMAVIIDYLLARDQ